MTSPSLAGDLSRYRTSRWYGGHGQITADDHCRCFSLRATLTVEAEVKVTDDVFARDNDLLGDFYAPYGRVCVVIDETVDQFYGQRLRGYFDARGLPCEVLSVRAWERDKGSGLVDRILAFFRTQRVSRHEAPLIIGGGVLSDTSGLAAALHHRRTPYVMIGTTIISAIDAGPSPRTCVNGDGFKNHMGAYHLPALTLVDRRFFRTLHPAHVRHGLAEILKMAFVDDVRLFELMRDHGERLLATQFATTDDDAALSAVADEVIYRALRSYMGHEGTNPWEVHQARPHAYGHTWSPGYELPAGLLHGHAVSSGMGLGASLAHELGWIDAADRDAIIDVMSRLGLAVYHPVMTDLDLLRDAQAKMVEKRGGTLWAPLPKGRIGVCDYAEDVSPALLSTAIERQRARASKLPRGGEGLEQHLADLGHG